MKKNQFTLAVLILLGLGVLIACTGFKIPREFKGKSLSYTRDNIVRNDVLKSIYIFEKNLYQCHDISTVWAQIISIKEYAPNRKHVVEKWLINACGKERIYKVTMTEDQRKEVDIIVTSNPGPF